MSSATHNLTLNCPIALGSPQTWTVGAGRTLTVTGGMSGLLGFTKAGAGMLVLSGANTYTGGTTLTAGTLSVNTIADSGTSALGTSGAITVYGDGSNVPTFQYTGLGLPPPLAGTAAALMEALSSKSPRAAAASPYWPGPTTIRRSRRTVRAL
jgi:autotransporter-associated beta strand protein